MPDVGVLNLSIKSNSASAATNLGNLADALTRVKSAVGRSLGSKIEGVATSIEKIKAATQGGMGTGMAGIAKSITSVSKNLSKSNVASNFRKAAEAINEYADAYHRLSGGVSLDRVRAGAMMKLDLGQFGSKSKSDVSDIVGEQLKMDLDSIDSGFKNVERTIQGAVEDSHELMSTVNGNALDFSKFDISKLPISSLGMKMDEASRDITRFGTVVKDTFETVRDQGALDTVSKIEEVGNAVTAIIPYNENLNNSWENICNTISKANGEISEQAAIVESVNAAQVAKENDLDADAVKTIKVNFDVQKPTEDTFGEFNKEEIEASANAVQLNESLKNVDKELKQKKKDAKGASSGFHDLNKAMKGAFPTLARIEKQFGKIIMRRAITAVIRAVSKAFKESIENVYKYSEAIGSSFAPALDSAKTMMNQFKNSIGAAVAPLIQALIPVFNQIVSAAISVINVLNQLFSLISGRTSWTRALPVAASAFEDTEKAAKGAGGAVKDMLADFDELNVLDQNGGGGGGGAAAKTAEAYEDMFEEVGEFDRRIREIVDFIKDNFESIKWMALDIGAAILMWKLSSAFAEVLPSLSKFFALLAELGVITVTLQATWLLTNKYLDTGDIGWLLTDVLTTALGTTAAAVIAKQFLGGAKSAAWAASITLTLSAVTGIIALIKNTNVDALSKESILTAIENAIKIGGAVAIAAKGIFGLGLGVSLLIGAGAALATFGVIIGLKALLQTSKDDIEWGNVHLTEQQIDSFVRQHMFTVDPQVIINLSAENIKNLRADEQAISDKIAGMIGTINVIKLGIADADDYTYIYEQITGTDGLISKVQTYIDHQDETAKLVLKFTPKLLGENEEEQKQWYENNKSQWDTVMGFVNDLGEKLGAQFVEGENGAIMNGSSEVVATVLEQIERISSILAGTDTATEALIDLDKGLMGFDKSTFHGALDLFNQYKNDAMEAAKALQDELIEQKTRVVMALTEMLKIDPNNSEVQEKLAEAKTDLETLKTNYDTMIDKTFADYLQPGRSLMQDWLEHNFGKGSVNITWTNDLLEDALQGLHGLSEGLLTIFEEVGITGIDIADLMQIGGWDLLAEDLQKKIVEYVVVNPDTVAQVKNDLKMDITQLLKIVNWQQFSTEQRLNFINALISAYGTQQAMTIAKQAGLNVSTAVSEGLNFGNTSVIAAASGIADAVKSELESRQISVPIDASLQTQIDILVNVTPQVQGGVLNAVKATATSVVTDTKKLFEKLGAILVRPKASGAYDIPAGELFLANEAGPELIGTIGGKTSVANQQQIVDGISKGVSDANAEQNALLREQNNLLRQLLAKDSTVRIGASAALGRTVRQSLDMYGTMAGG